MEPSTSGQGTSGPAVERKCKVCTKEFSAVVKPRMLPCLHTVCSQCLANVTNNTAVASGQQGNHSGAVIAKCPICREDIRNIEDVLEDTWTVQTSSIQASQTTGDMMCTNCDKAVSTSFCVDCQESLCEPCVLLHQKVKILKDHVIQSKSEMENQSRESSRMQPPFCSLHPKERLQLYCETCVKLTCRDCQLQSHKEHVYQFLSEAAIQQRASLRKFKSQLEQKKMNTNKMRSDIRNIYQKMKGQEAAVLKSIDEIFKRMIMTLNQRAEILKSHVKGATDNKTRSLKQQVQEVELVESSVNLCMNVINSTLASNNDVAALLKNRLITRRVDTILRTIITRQPVSEMLLRFTTDNLPKLEDLNQIGKLSCSDKKLVMAQHPQQRLSQATAAAAAAAASAAASATGRPGQPILPQPISSMAGRLGQPMMPQVVSTRGGNPTIIPQRGGFQQMAHPGQPVAPGMHVAMVSQQQVRPPLQTNIIPVVRHQQQGVPPTGTPGRAIAPNITLEKGVPMSMTFGDLTNAQRLMIMASRKNLAPGMPTTPNRTVANAVSGTTNAVSGTSTAVTGGEPSIAISSVESLSGAGNRGPNSSSPSTGGAVAEDSSMPRILNVKSERQSKSESDRPSCRFHNSGGNGLQDNQPSSSGLEMQQGSNSEKTSPASEMQSEGGESDRQDHHSDHAPTPTPPPTLSKTPPQVVPIVLTADDIVQEAELDIPPITSEVTSEKQNSEATATPTAPVVAAEAKTDRDEPARGHEEPDELRVFFDEMDTLLGKAKSTGVTVFWQGKVTWDEKCDQGEPRCVSIVASLFRLENISYTVENWPDKLHIKLMKVEILTSLVDLLRDHHMFLFQAEAAHKEAHKKLVTIFRNKDLFGAIRLQKKPDTAMVMIFSHKYNKFYLLCPKKTETFLAEFCKTVKDHFHKVQPKTVSVRQEQEPATVAESDSDANNEDVASTSHKRRHDSAADNEQWIQSHPDDLRNPTQCSRSDDPNDDWCAVCNNGGELICCDNCPRVFHLDCHVPVLKELPGGAWSCTLCFDVNAEEEEYEENIEKLNGFTAREFKLCQRLLLEMVCRQDSLPFLEPVSEDVPGYFERIQTPMDLSTIKSKLSVNYDPNYSSPQDFMDDLRIMFTNCYLYNGDTSDIGKVARRLQRFSSKFIKRFLPEYSEAHKPYKPEERPSKKRKQDASSVVHIR